MTSSSSRRIGILSSTALALLLLALLMREPSADRSVRPAPQAPGGPTPTAAPAEAGSSDASLPTVQHIDGSAIAESAQAATRSGETPEPTGTPRRQTGARSATTEAPAGLPPLRAETQRWFAPVARARSYGELAAALATLPGEASARRELLEPIARWCRTAAQEVYDTEAFQRYAPLRWHAMQELRAFCIDAPDRTPLAGDWIQPLGMTLLMHFGRQTVGNLDPALGADAGRAALRDARQLIDRANALQWMQIQGLLPMDPALGCRLNCGPYYWAAAMLIACEDAGGCGYRSPVTLGYCAANFGGGGCRPGADYAVALRDRLSQADWIRVQRAVRELRQNLAESG